MNWKTDAELFALVHRELFTCVVGDVMDKFHFPAPVPAASNSAAAARHDRYWPAMPVLSVDVF